MRALLLLAVVLVTLPSIAQGQNQRQAQFRFQAFDTNGDRVITRNEWRGSDQSFRVHDWNGDGVLSGEEVRIGARRPRTSAPDFSTDDEFDDWTARGFTSLDHNRDGRITRDEWHFNQEGFVRADHNSDGVLNRSEFLGESVEDDRDDRFAYLDADNNGRIQPDEWHATRREFTRLDRNADGVLSRAELGAETGSPGGAGTETFASLDTNRNGVISFNEWHWSRNSFDQRDANRNGVLDRAEYRGASAVGTSGQTIVVPATERWTDSGMDARRGDILHIQASGNITMSGPSDSATPAGSTTGRRAASAPLPDQPAGGLVLRIGDAAPIYVGAASRSIQAPADGRIYFGVNDDHLPDNAGEFRVSLQLQRRN
jgi:Ca2+-binding EF-hand superfamily protein